MRHKTLNHLIRELGRRGKDKALLREAKALRLAIYRQDCIDSNVVLPVCQRLSDALKVDYMRELCACGHTRGVHMGIHHFGKCTSPGSREDVPLVDYNTAVLLGTPCDCPEYETHGKMQD